MELLYTHAGFMSAGFLLLCTGFVVVRFFRTQAWWLKVHRLCGIIGGSCCVVGLFAVTLNIILMEGQHLRIPHSYIGLVAFILVVANPVLGFMQFRYREHIRAFRQAHRWCGRVAILLMLINLLLGLSMIGIL